MVSAAEVLTVINGLQEVNLDQLEFAIITHKSSGLRGWYPFEEHEVLVLEKFEGREPFGDQRKPDKWDVQYETFSTFAEVTKRLKELKG